ncbi:MAG: hypothetical protein A2725_04625 [Candidatus Magasanikbacteria bacterium RIFCSPHIGHO2_01_FULL_33_34]|uniref:DUF5673 domain-containing protein n=1 Tax=Candidatus Magasanikbacteria bacterium RIFCSPHIGHO2_01_FULL_33_34 TaxID=1798671 RepID=A0A1F6LLJ5_9BACT|nr:MAG: hypothetical protein A2725_04625 [Candidatus Magasanikbacteria bacterium RIFCSPHIGHO2_01_FULL_33_34]OGH65963.1 MAG: hypothetical protein A3B83_02445 [Candidatus Magasanikbacteria bacterium RIFCSPHIGHO2_02_FULL_33_17]OGH76358.1 MAG: hypothetical protein A3A89_00985 [Candidatus Magasanikbacteria bacterium RIFCSPLOWO2_01_FULL_33_34]OGH82277.1 MAG: hypothetical protein A3F93_03240 [Candidatus Magasanikbacteria bacterium RIFCSPLOWO2_12_FULL_34_7]
MPEILRENSITGDVAYEWTVQEFDRHQRGLFWYIFMITVGMILVIYGFLSNNFLFSLIIVLSAIILFIQSYQEPAQVLFSITELGVVLGNRFYKYSELESFYIIYQPPEIKTLFIQPKSGIRPLLRIPLLDQDPLDIREAMTVFLEEDFEKETEPLTDLFARQWKIH